MDDSDLFDPAPGNGLQVSCAAAGAKSPDRPGPQGDDPLVVARGLALAPHHGPRNQLRPAGVGSGGAGRVPQDGQFPVAGRKIVNHPVVAETSGCQREGLAVLGVDGCPGVSGAPVQIPGLDAGSLGARADRRQVPLGTRTQPDASAHLDIKRMQPLQQELLHPRSVPGHRPHQPYSPGTHGEFPGERAHLVQQGHDVHPKVGAQPLHRSQSEGWTAPEAAVHPGNPVVPRSAETLHSLQRHQGEQPVAGHGAGCY